MISGVAIVLGGLVFVWALLLALVLGVFSGCPDVIEIGEAE